MSLERLGFYVQEGLQPRKNWWIVVLYEKLSSDKATLVNALNLVRRPVFALKNMFRILDDTVFETVYLSSIGDMCIHGFSFSFC